MNGVTIFPYNELREVIGYPALPEEAFKPITPKTTDVQDDSSPDNPTTGE
jgi:hypothetical protein